MYWWIRQAIVHAVGDQSRTIRLPSQAVELLTRVAGVAREIQTVTGVMPSEQSVAEALEIGVDKIVEEGQAARMPLSIDAQVDFDSDTVLGDALADANAEGAVHAGVELGEFSLWISRALGQLDPHERAVLQMRFGLGGVEELSLSDIVRKTGFGRERLANSSARPWQSFAGSPDSTTRSWATSLLHGRPVAPSWFPTSHQEEMGRDSN